MKKRYLDLIIFLNDKVMQISIDFIFQRKTGLKKKNLTEDTDKKQILNRFIKMPFQSCWFS